MGKILNSDQAVDNQLAHLRRLDAPTVLEEGLSELIWSKVPTPSPLSFFQPLPAFSLCVVVALSVAGFFAFQKGSLVPSEQTVTQKNVQLKMVALGLENMSKGTPRSLQAGSVFRDTHGTFYLPTAGYVSVEEGTSFRVEKASQEWPSGKSTYEIVVERGKIYSHFPELENGSVLQFKTPFGAATVVGTDFVLDVQAIQGLMLDVLEGFVDLRPEVDGRASEQVGAGYRGAISSSSTENIYVTDIEPTELDKLKAKFAQQFEGVNLYEGSGKSKGKEAPKIRLLYHQQK